MLTVVLLVLVVDLLEVDLLVLEEVPEALLVTGSAGSPGSCHKPTEFKSIKVQ